MAIPNKEIILFLTQNLKLHRSLQAALENLAVIRVTTIDEVSQAVRHQPVKAIILHLANAGSWIIFEMLKTGYRDMPRFAVLSPSFGRDKDPEVLAKKYDAIAVTQEQDGFKALANLVAARVSGATKSVPVEEEFQEIYSAVGQELLRLQGEYNVAGMRILPQPNIGKDTKERLKSVLTKLKNMKITPWE
jgi:hypothetical protein